MFEEQLRADLAMLGYESEKIDNLLNGFTHELAETLKEQGPPKSSYGSPTRHGYYMAIQRLDRTGLNIFWSE